MKLGFGPKVLGRPGFKSHDSRRWQNEPHLSVSLAYLRDIITHLGKNDIRMYRMSSQLAPYATHPDLPQFHEQIDECSSELALVGDLIRDARVRLSVHPAAYVVLNAPDEGLARKSMGEIDLQARLLDAMGAGPEAVVVVHVGGVYDDKAQAIRRFVARYEDMTEPARRRLALEHDDASYSVADVTWIYQRTGVPLVFDYLHYRNHNPERMPLWEALSSCLATWPEEVAPKVHFSSPRTEMRVVSRSDANGGDHLDVLRAPLWTQHSDFLNPFEFINFLQAAEAMGQFDVMLEAKGKDLALLRLREDLAAMAPNLAARFVPSKPAHAREGRRSWDVAVEIQATEEDEELLALVAIMNNKRDLEIARTEGWYRIPLKHAPWRVGADYLAFYQTRAFTKEKWSVNYYAPVKSYRIVSRAELLPDEVDHPRADERYYKVEIGELRRLPQPIPSRRLRRVTFIPTTLEKLLSAEEINDLWLGARQEERLWAEFKREGIDAERRYSVQEGGEIYTADFVLFRRDGAVAVLCGEGGGQPAPSVLRERRSEYAETAEVQTVLRFTSDQIDRDTSACVEAVTDALSER